MFSVFLIFCPKRTYFVCVCVACASIKQNDWVIYYVPQKQNQHASVRGSNTKLNIGSACCCFTYIHTLEHDSGTCLFLWSGKSIHWSYCNCLCICASQVIALFWLFNTCLYRVPLCIWRFLPLVKQKFDKLRFIYIICHGTFPVHCVWDQSNLRCSTLFAPKNLNEFSLDVSVTKSTLDDFTRRSYTIFVTPWKASCKGERT